MKYPIKMSRRSMPLWVSVLVVLLFILLTLGCWKAVELVVALEKSITMGC